MTISARIAASSVDQTREMLEEAFRAVFGEEPPSEYDGLAWKQNKPDFSPVWTTYIKKRVIFHNFLAVQAYHDAAIMLIPEGLVMAAETYDSPGVKAPHVHASAWVQGAERQFASSAPLAIAAAAVKVKESE